MKKALNNGQPPLMEPEGTLALRVGEKQLHLIGETVFAEFPEVDCFEVRCRDGQIILEPLQRELPTLEEIWDKVDALGITEEDVAAEVAAVRAERDGRGPATSRRQRADAGDSGVIGRDR